MFHDTHILLNTESVCLILRSESDSSRTENEQVLPTIFLLEYGVELLLVLMSKVLSEPVFFNLSCQFHTFFLNNFMSETSPFPDIDIGLAVRQKMSEYGTTIAWLARQVRCDKGNLHKQLHKKHIYPELLLKISIALKTDFFTDYSHYLQDNHNPKNLIST